MKTLGKFFKMVVVCYDLCIALKAGESLFRRQGVVGRKGGFFCRCIRQQDQIDSGKKSKRIVSSVSKCGWM